MSSPSPPLTPPTSDSECEPNPDNDLRDHPTSRTKFQSFMRTSTTSSPHPFAASSKANRPPPSYEKKTLYTPPATPVEFLGKMPSVERRDYRRQVSCASSYASSSPDELEQNLWDATISSAIDGAKAKIDLSGANLTFIPPSIIDLKNLVVLPKLTQPADVASRMSSRSFKRSATAPALLHSQQHKKARPFLPTATANALSFAAQMHKKRIESMSKCEIEMYLMRNAIRTLPRELFTLDCLVVLSLRQNKLASLPPAIGQLTRLRELNVASNRLAYLPSEILNLKLTSLHLQPNPFTPMPPNLYNAKRTRTIGPLRRGPPVPSLSEFILRFLLSPASSDARSLTRLETLTTEPPERLYLPNHLQRIVRASTGHSSASEKGTIAEEDMRANVCSNPRHVRRGICEATTSSGRFCTPVVMMMEWVGVVAGVTVADDPQAWVPILWRGCSNDCLTYLEEDADEEESGFIAGTGEDGEAFEFSDED